MHMGGNTIADQDTLVLHHQDQRLHRAELEATASGCSKHGWRRYYLATPSDVGVDAFRRWLDMAGAISSSEHSPDLQCMMVSCKCRSCADVIRN